jgi:hypothetical protein
MASRFRESCTPWGRGTSALLAVNGVRIFARIPLVTVFFLLLPNAAPQALLKPPEAGQSLTLNPSDMEILESDDARRDLPCTVTPAKPELGFDLRFHGSYTVTVPLKELGGTEDLLTVLFRVYPENDKSSPAYFVQHFRVPSVDEDAKGDASLQGVIDLGEGQYHVDWLIRDRSERSCSSSWDYDASLPQKDKPMMLFIAPKQIAETVQQPFTNDSTAQSSAPLHPPGSDEQLSVKVLVNFAPQHQDSAALQRTDTDALITILKTIQRDPRVTHISLVAFNMEESRILYKQESSGPIDFSALGHALETMKLGTISVQHLDQKHSEGEFLGHLIQNEVAAASHSDAFIFAGPKTMLDADVPQEDLRRIGDIECPVFYMNYNLNPQAVPWKDSISHAIRAFKGTEYTISRPRDLWFSTSEMLDRILRSKQQHTLSGVLNAGGSR